MKIEQDNIRTTSLRNQKMELLQARREARDEANRQKESMQKKFEYLQSKGKLDVSHVFL